MQYVRQALGEDVISERRACRVLGQSRSTQRRIACIPDDEPQLVQEMVKLALSESIPFINRILLQNSLLNTLFMLP